MHHVESEFGARRQRDIKAYRRGVEIEGKSSIGLPIVGYFKLMNLEAGSVVDGHTGRNIKPEKSFKKPKKLEILG